MFSFYSMYGNYEQRVVKNTKINGATIDTAAVTDSREPYETGIQHPKFNKGGWVIVEMYHTRKQAEKGHEKWVKIFKKGLPDELTDVSTCEVQEFADMFGGLQRVFKRED